MGTVVLITGSTMADALGGIARSFQGLFGDLGYEFLEIGLSNAERAVEQINGLATKRDIELVYSFMAAGGAINVTTDKGDERNLWEALRIPYISIYGDSPSYFFDRHVHKSGIFASLYGFPEHYQMRKRLPLIKGFTGICPPLLLDLAATEELDFKRKAAGDLLFLKNGNDPRELRQLWKSTLSPKPLQIIQDIADELEAHIADEVGNDIDALVVSYFKNHDFDIDGLLKLRLLFVAQLDHYMRRVKGTLMAEALMDFPVQIRGYGWDYLDFSGKPVTFVAGGDYVESRQLIRENLGMIDMSPNTGLAPHDRALRSIGAYTLCLTNQQKFYEPLPGYKDFSFRFEKENIQARIADVLAHRERYVELGIEVADAFRKKYPPHEAVRYLLDVASLVQLDQRPMRSEETPPYFVWPPTALS